MPDPKDTGKVLAALQLLEDERDNVLSPEMMMSIFKALYAHFDTVAERDTRHLGILSVNALVRCLTHARQNLARLTRRDAGNQ